MQLHERVVAIVAKEPARRDRGFCDQLLRSCAGAAPSIAEGFARFLPTDFKRFLRYALGSLAEAQTHIRQGRQRGLLSIEEFEEALSLARRAAGATGKLRASIQGPPDGG